MLALGIIDMMMIVEAAALMLVSYILVSHSLSQLTDCLDCLYSRANSNFYLARQHKHIS